MDEQLWITNEHGKAKIMNENKTITYHYVIDIHDPDGIWCFSSII